MKGIFVALSLMLTTAAFADERVEIRGGLVLIRCEKSSETTIECTAPVSAAEPIAMDLTGDQPDFLRGSHTFKLENEGYVFEGTIEVNKVEFDNQHRYLVSGMIVTTPVDQPENRQYQYMGTAVVKNVSELNEIYFSGKSMNKGDVSIQPMLMIGPKDATFKSLSLTHLNRR